MNQKKKKRIWFRNVMKTWLLALPIQKQTGLNRILSSGES